MKLPFYVSAALVSLAAAGGTAIAQRDMAGAVPAPRDHGGRMIDVMQADSDKDGKVSRVEAMAGADTAFARLDLNKDGRIDEADRAMMHKQRAERQFAMLDGNKDGQVSRAEYDAAFNRARPSADPARQARVTELAAERFAAFDTNKDAIVTRAEFDALVGTMPGRAGGREREPRPALTAADMRARVGRMFDMADSNKDGFLTREEVAAADAARGPRSPERGHMPPPPPAPGH